MAVRLRLVLSLILVTFVFTAHVRAATEGEANTTTEAATTDDPNTEAPTTLDPIDQDLNGETTTTDTPPSEDAETTAADSDPAETTTENPDIAAFEEPDGGGNMGDSGDPASNTTASNPADVTDEKSNTTTASTTVEVTTATDDPGTTVTDEAGSSTAVTMRELVTAEAVTPTATPEATTTESTPAEPHFKITMAGRDYNQTVNETVTVTDLTAFEHSFVEQVAILLKIDEDSINIRGKQSDESVVTIEFDVTKELAKARKTLPELVETGELSIEHDEQTWEATKLEGTEVDEPIVPKPDFVITLDGDFAKITNKASFKEAFKKQLAEKLNISEEFIVIKDVREGSIVVDFDITDKAAKESAAKALPTLVETDDLKIKHNGQIFAAKGLDGNAIDEAIVPKKTPTPQAPVTEKPVEPYPYDLSRTDIIVIGVACVICILLIVLGIIVCCRECRKRKDKNKFSVNEAEGYYRNVSLEEFNSIPRPHVKYDRGTDEVKYENGRDDFELIKAPEETIDRRKLVRTDISADVGGVDNPVFKKSEIDEENKTTF